MSHFPQRQDSRHSSVETMSTFRDRKPREKRSRSRRRTSLPLLSGGSMLPFSKSSDHGESHESGHGHFKYRLRNRKRFLVVSLLFIALFGLFNNGQVLNQLGRHLSGVGRRLCGIVDWGANDPDYIGPWNENYNTDPYNLKDMIYFDPARVAATVEPPVVDRNMSVGYVMTFINCPDERSPVDMQYEPDGAAFYDAAAVFRQSVCNGTVYEYKCVVFAIVHPNAVRCQNQDGTYYDRVKMLQELRYWVRIWGAPASEDMLASSYLRDNINSDVGILDHTKLHAWWLTRHELIVLTDFSTIVLQTHDDLLDSIKFDSGTGAYVTNAAGGVDTGFYILKPSNSSYVDLVDKYIHDYNDTLGWGGLGIQDFSGSLGVSGLLKYYHQEGSNPAMELNRCIYGNSLLDTTCKNEPFANVVIGRMMDVCGAPWDCYKDPSWDVLEQERCKAYFNKWFNYRSDFEESIWFQGIPANKSGTYHIDYFLGYCFEEGSDGYKPMIPDNRLCEGTAACPSGQYMTNDCICVTDPCTACPDGTRCQNDEGTPIMCVDCSCGFCNVPNEGCCQWNGNNNCVNANNDKECKLQTNFFSSWTGSGSVCSGVELSLNAVPNGCGCQPSSESPCTYSDRWRSEEERCFICSAGDLLLPQDPLCEDCYDCLVECNGGISTCFESAITTSAMQNCLSNIADQTCRSVTCADSCNKVSRLLVGDPTRNSTIA